MKKANLTMPPPYPRLGEIYRALAVALNTKPKSKIVDRLAREGEFNWKLASSLSEELVVAPLAKHDPDMADLIEQWIKHVHAGYIHLVSTISLDSLSRNEALPLLAKNYFALHAIGLIVGIRKAFDGPDLTKLFDPELHPVAVVLEWLDQGEQRSLAKTAFPSTTGADRTNHEMVKKWTRGTNLPDRSSINLFAEAVKKAGVQNRKVENLRRWLIVARALAYLEQESPVLVRAFMLRHLILGMPDFDVGRVLSLAVIDAGDKHAALKMAGLMLYENLKRTTPKEVGDQAKTKLELEELERLSMEHEPEGRTRFHLEWLNGRWLVLSGRYADALTHYEQAADLANYRGGESQKRIVEEALVLAARLRDKSLLNHLKHRAVAFGLFSDPRDDDVIEDWEIDHLSQQFHRIFPEQGRFPEAEPVHGDQVQLPFLVFNEAEIASIEPNLRKPDQVKAIRAQDGQVRYVPQLSLFASLGKTDEVKALLERGAPVDQLDAAGASALLRAIQFAAETGKRQTLDMLLQHQHTKATLDSATTRRQLTPLICAVDFGEPDVVQRLLEMGASPDRRGNIVDETPLYFVMENVSAIRDPANLYRYLRHTLLRSPDLVQKEVFRRYNISLAGVFGDSRGINAMIEDPSYRKIFEDLVSAMVEEKIGRHSMPKVIKIIELLLEHKAYPNAPHSYPAPGRTPLMLAAEDNSGQVFDLMMRHGGNPYQPDAAGMTCIQFAIGFRAGEVISYLRTKGII